MGHWEKAQESLVKALDYRTESKLNVIDSALQSTLVSDLCRRCLHPCLNLVSPSTETEAVQTHRLPFKSALQT